MSLISHPNFRKYFANTSWLMAERILRMGINLLVGIYVARYLGPKQFGQLSYAMSFVSFFAVIAMLGLDHIVIRELVKEQYHPHKLLGTSFILKMVGSLIAVILVVVTSSFASNSADENFIVFIIAASLFFQSFTVIDFYFQASVKSRFVVYAQIAQLFISSIIKLALVWIEASLLWFALVLFIDSIVFAFGLVIVYRCVGYSPSNWRYSNRLAKILMRDSWPLMLSGVAITIYMKVDQIMIKEMLGAEAVGIYAAAVRISEAWYFIPMAITGSLFPAIISIKEKSEEQYHHQLQKLFNLLVWLAVAIAIPMTFMSDWLIVLLFGEMFLQAGNVLSIHIWAGVFTFLGCAVGRSLVADNKQSLNLYRNILGLTVNIGLNFILIPSLGIKGAALASLISYSVSAYLVISFFEASKKQFILATRSLFPLKYLDIKNGNR